MKKISFITIVFFAFCAWNQASVQAQICTLTVKINGISDINGNIRIGLYNNAEKFPDVGGEYKVYKFNVTATAMTYSISLPQGTYALALFHDENSDGECNTNWLGIPTEGYGFSNNVKPVISAPSFDDVKITVNKNMTISIDLIY